jgi:dihydroneopterin aldolase
MPEKSQNSVLKIDNYELLINIGVGENERREKQRILFSIEIHFQITPIAAISDEIKDTICYHSMCDKLAEFNNRAFNTIEALAQENFTFIQNIFSANNIKLQVTKFPIIENLKGGVSFVIDNTSHKHTSSQL